MFSDDCSDPLAAYSEIEDKRALSRLDRDVEAMPLVEPSDRVAESVHGAVCFFILGVVFGAGILFVVVGGLIWP